MRFRARVGIVAALSVLLSGLVVAQPATAATVTASDLPGLLTVATETTSPAYDRDRFEHWIDADGDGCNTRYEVLITESKTPVTRSGSCTLSGGSWTSVYDSASATSVAQLEIDHVVALAEAWRSGASAWTDAQRRDFANDIDVPFALVAVSSSSNQSKSDKDPAKWLPSNTAYQCQYVTDWALVKYRWSLSVDSAELSAISRVLSGTCGATAVTLPAVLASAVEPGPKETVIDPFAQGTTRLAGADRYATAITASKKFHSNVPAVFVATGTAFPDALSASAAAALLGGPLLLTPSASLPATVSTEIARLNPGKIFIVGGTGAVSSAVESALSKIAPTSRLGGASRYDTSLSIVNNTFESSSLAIIATGRTFPDALAATGAAGAEKAPVILVDGTVGSVNAATLNTLKSLGVTTVAIAGGTGAVSAGIQQQLAGSYTVTRLGGSDRYETAARINLAYFGAGSTSTMFLATGMDFPDALSGAALAGRLGAPMYVTRATCVPDVVHAEINSLNPSTRVVMGGTGVVSNAAAANTVCAAAPAPKPTTPTQPTPAPTTPVVDGYVTAGAFCATADHGKIGYTSTGKKMKCTTSSTDSKYRWRAA